MTDILCIPGIIDGEEIFSAQGGSDELSWSIEIGHGYAEVYLRGMAGGGPVPMVQLILGDRGAIDLTEVIVLSVSMFGETSVSVELNAGGVRHH